MRRGGPRAVHGCRLPVRPSDEIGQLEDGNIAEDQEGSGGGPGGSEIISLRRDAMCLVEREGVHYPGVIWAAVDCMICCRP